MGMEQQSPTVKIGENGSSMKSPSRVPVAAKKSSLIPRRSSLIPKKSGTAKTPEEPVQQEMGEEESEEKQKSGTVKIPEEPVQQEMGEEESEQKQKSTVTLTERKAKVPTKIPTKKKLQNDPNPVESEAAANPPRPPGSPGRALYLLKLAKTSHISGDKPSKTLDYASRAAKMLEASSPASEKPTLELVMCLHIVAAAYCRMGKYEEAVDALEKTLQSLLPMEWIAEAGNEYSLAAFAGYMQLGDTYTKLGMQGKALESYKSALTIQKQAVGEMDPQVGETCRYLAEAYLQAMQFKEAEELCEQVLRIHAEKSPTGGSIEEAVDRRLMALIQSGKGEYEAALEHLVFASTAMSSKGHDTAVASIDASIGDCYAALGRYEEAVFSYQKAVSAFKQIKGEGHASVAAMYVSLGDLSLKTGKMRDAKAYCENALRIYGQQGAGHAADELAAGLTDIAGIYEALNEREQALCLLQRALETIQKLPGEQRAAAAIEAQMGVLFYVMGNFSESYQAFNSALVKLKSAGENSTPMLGVLLNQMGLALFELEQIHEAVEVLEEAQHVLAQACGIHHPDTIAVCSNLAGGYDALGRVDDAIDLLDKVLQSQEERLGTVHPDVVDERARLEQMLKEAGKPLVRKTSTLEELLMRPAAQSKRYQNPLALA